MRGESAALSSNARGVRVEHSLLRPVSCQSLRRVGGPNDGGYVVPVHAIQSAAVLLSFGLANDWSFERGAASLNPDLRIESFDPSVGRTHFLGMGLRSAISVPLRFLTLSPSGARSSATRVARAIDYFRFFSAEHRHHTRRIWYNNDHGSAKIDEVVDSAGSMPLSIFAKIDIEGTEYRILPALIARAARFTGLMIEFHNVDICAELFNAQMMLLREHFEVVHIHGNNFGDLNEDHSLPLSLEISFLNKGLFSGRASPYRGPLPRPGLDAPNDPRRADYVIELDISAPRESA